MPRGRAAALSGIFGEMLDDVLRVPRRGVDAGAVGRDLPPGAPRPPPQALHTFQGDVRREVWPAGEVRYRVVDDGSWVGGPSWTRDAPPSEHGAAANPGIRTTHPTGRSTAQSVPQPDGRTVEPTPSGSVTGSARRATRRATRIRRTGLSADPTRHISGDVR